MKAKITLFVLLFCISFYVFATTNSSATYSVTVSYADATCTLTLNPTPSQTICIGAMSNLSANASSGIPPYSYQWSDGSNTPSINVGPVTTTVYTVTVTDGSSCIVTSAPIIITVNLPLLVSAMVN